MKHLTIIYNPKSGATLFRLPYRLQRQKNEVNHFFSQRGIAVTFKETRYPNHAQKLVKELSLPCDCLAVMGGDGTLNEVIQALVGTSIPLGIIPTGTANVFARNLGIPIPILQACEFLLNAPFTCLSLGQVNTRYFTCMMGIGFDAFVISQADKWLKKYLGKYAYFMSALLALCTYPNTSFLVTTDHTNTLQSCFSIVSRGPYYAGHYVLDACYSMTESKLLTVHVTRHSRWAILCFFWHLYKGTLNRYKDVTIIRCDTCNIQSTRYAHVDAELLDTPNVDCCLSNKTLKVFCH